MLTCRHFNATCQYTNPKRILAPKPGKVTEDIGLYVNADKTESICFKPDGDISTRSGKSLKQVDKFTSFGSNIASTKSDVIVRWGRRGLVFNWNHFEMRLLNLRILAQRIETLSLYGSRWALSADSGFKSYPSRPEVYLVKNVVR